MADSVADDVIRRQDRFRTFRVNFDNVWNICAQIALPRADDFLGKRSPGQRNSDNFIYDSTAQLALPVYAAAVESMVCPRTQKWHTLKPVYDGIKQDYDVRQYLDAMRDLLFQIRYSPGTNFASTMSESFIGLGAFGNYTVFTEDGMHKGIRYQAIPLVESFWAEDSYGTVDTFHRKYTLTARQAMQRPSWQDAMPQSIKTAAEKEPDKEFEFIHCVRPNEERRSGAGWRGYDKSAYDICIEGRVLLDEGGYRTMPYAVGRDITAPREVYARGALWNCLSDAKMLQTMGRDSIRYAQLTLDPPTLTADVDSLAAYSRRAGAINAGYLTDQGGVLAKEMPPQADPRPSLEVADQRRTNVKNSLLANFFQFLQQNPQMTATQAMFIAQEKGMLVGPVMSRQQETMSMIVSREIDILMHAGVFEEVLGPIPQKLLDNGGIAVEYDSPLTRAQRSQEGVGILQTIEAIGPLANIDPTVLDRIDADETLKILADVNGAPARFLRSDAATAAIKSQRAAQQQLQNLVEAAPAAAGAAKDLASAHQTASSVPV